MHKSLVSEAMMDAVLQTRRLRFVLTTLVCCFCFWTGLAKSDDMPRGRALLIGCTKYDHLDSSMHLQGPANDVEMMKDLLESRFGFTSEQIVLLSENAGKQELRPTRINIEREFHRLSQIAKTGEPVVVLLAGHGSQQPDFNPLPDDPEPDGLDELFLPADVKAWDGRIGRVPNAIIDDELRAWLSAIEQRQCAVTVIVDACHSGTMTRGFGERVRQIPPGVLVPPSELSKTGSSRVKAESPDENELTRGGGRTVDTNSNVPTAVAIYASQSSEVTVERLLPPEGTDRKPHGLLTYTICQVLSRSTESLTCRQLVRHVQAQYAAAGRSTPTPMIEGKDRDRELFGLSVWPDRSRFLLSRKAQAWSINAGLLQGITQNSILAVFPLNAITSSQPIGHVRVQIARTIDADVVPCTEGGLPASTHLPEKGECELVFTDAGDLRLKVAVIPGREADSESVQSLINMLQPESLSKLRIHLVHWVPAEAKADWLIRVSGQELLLIPAEFGDYDGGDSNHAPPHSIGPHHLDDTTIEWLAPALERIARAANLKRLATDDNIARATGPSARIEVELERPSSDAGRAQSQRVTLRNGDPLKFRIKNPCIFPVDVTLLCIDSECGINALYPREGEINRLQPGDSFPLATKVVAENPGVEHLVAIAVKSDREVIDFTCLAQPSLDALKTRGHVEDPSLTSPLGLLLKHAVFSDGQTRGVKRTAVKGYSLELLTWEIKP
jgi:hypothetical protein